MFWATYSVAIWFMIAAVSAGFLPSSEAPMMPLCLPFSEILSLSCSISSVLSRESRCSSKAAPALAASVLTSSWIVPTLCFASSGSPTTPSMGVSRLLFSSR